MAKRFDATTKALLQSDLKAWVEVLLKRKVGRVRVLNVELSTVTGETLIIAMQKCLEREATHTQYGTLWAATYVLMGLKYKTPLIDHLLDGMQSMKESVTYQKILREGRAAGLVAEEMKLFKRLATKRFGKPSNQILAVLNGIIDVQRLEELSDRMLEAKSWDELLGQR
jgi:predicted transposase YdaD